MEQSTRDRTSEPVCAPEVKLCGCGCGKPAPIAKRTDKRHGHVKGQPTAFVKGHTTKAFNPRRAGGAAPTLFVEVGQRFGASVVIETDVRISVAGRTQRSARLLCGCGNTFARGLSALLRTSNPHCGCRGSRFIDRTGQRFGKLVAVHRAEKGPRGRTDGTWWLCKCDCGNEALVNTSALGSGHTKSCGCWKKGPRSLGPGVAALNKVLNSYRQAAKQRSLGWDLSKEDFCRLTALDCHYCGGHPEARLRNGVYNGECVYNGLDRIDNSRGYFLDNVVACCTICNHAKKDMSYDDFLAWIARLTEYHFFHPDMMPSLLLRKAQ